MFVRNGNVADVLRRNREGVRLVEGQHLGEGHGVVPGEDLHLSHVVLLAGLPHQLDGEGLDVCDGELSYLKTSKNQSWRLSVQIYLANRGFLMFNGSGLVVWLYRFDRYNNNKNKRIQTIHGFTVNISSIYYLINKYR